MVAVVVDAWCGIVNSCPVMEGDDVTIGCYGQYDWLSYWLQFGPVASIISSIQFLEDSTTYQTISPDLRSAGLVRPPHPVTLTTTYIIQNLRAGDTIDSTCQIDFRFYESSGYSGRNTYAINSLQWSCSVRQPVSCEYCLFIKDRSHRHD